MFLFYTLNKNIYEYNYYIYIMINHIVLSGGGPYGFITYGCLKKLNLLNYWNIKNIKRIYGTSIGSIIGSILCLNINWEILDNYFINRPWDKALKNEIDNYLLHLINNNGIDGIKFIQTIMEPLLMSKNIDINVTLKEYFDLTKIELYIYVTNVNKMENIEFSYKSYPNIKLIEALSASSGYPLIFKPMFIDNMCLLDGGILNTFPLNNCIINNNLKNDENTLCINLKLFKNKNIDISMNIFELTYSILKKTHLLIDNNMNYNNFKKIITINCVNELNLKIENNIWLDVINHDSNIKNKLIKIGEQKAEKFCLYNM